MIEAIQTASSPRSTSAWLLPALVVVLVALVVSLQATPTLYYTPNTDSAIFLLIGEKILAGDLPFRDWYDHKPPLIFYLNALGLWFGQGSRWGVWAIELFSLAAAGLLAFAVVRRYFGTLAALVAATAMLLNLSFVLERGNLTEEYALPYQFAAIFLVSQIRRAQKTGGLLFLVGVSLAMASSLKQPLAGIGAAIAVYLAVLYLHQNRWLDLARAYGAVLLGFAIVWAAWFAYFAAIGIFPEFWEAAFAYNLALAGIPLERRLQALFSALDFLFEMSGFFLVGMLAWLAIIPYTVYRDHRLVSVLLKRPVGLALAVGGGVLVLFGLLANPLLTFAGLPVGLLGLVTSGRLAQWRLKPWLAARWPEHSAPYFLPLMIALVDLPVALVFTALSGNNFGHYFMALMPSLTLLTAFLVYSVMSVFKGPTGTHVRYVWLLALLLPVMLPGAIKTIELIDPHGDRQVEDVAQYVIDHTLPDDFVYQWGIVPQVNLLTGRASPTRYFFPDPLFVDGYSGREQTEELLRAFQSNPPVLIIDQSHPRLPLLMPDAGDPCESVADPQLYARHVRYWEPRVIYTLPQMPDGMTDVYYWVCQNYEPVTLVGELKWQVYRLKGK